MQDTRRPPNLLAAAAVCFILAALLFFLVVAQADAAPLTDGRLVSEMGSVTNFWAYPGHVQHYVAVKTDAVHVPGGRRPPHRQES